MAGERRRYIVDEDGSKVSVILPIEEYEELLEDLEDLALIAERRNEPTGPLEKVLERLEKKWQSSESSTRLMTETG